MPKNREKKYYQKLTRSPHSFKNKRSQRDYRIFTVFYIFFRFLWPQSGHHKMQSPARFFRAIFSASDGETFFQLPVFYDEISGCKARVLLIHFWVKFLKRPLLKIITKSVNFWYTIQICLYAVHWKYVFCKKNPARG